MCICCGIFCAIEVIFHDGQGKQPLSEEASNCTTIGSSPRVSAATADYNQQVGTTAVIQRYRIKVVALVFGLTAGVGLFHAAGWRWKWALREKRSVLLLVTFRMLVYCVESPFVYYRHRNLPIAYRLWILNGSATSRGWRVTQAGVALGLASELVKFSDWGNYQPDLPCCPKR